MGWSLAGALAAAVFFGLATVLQATAARAADRGGDGVDPRLLGRLLGNWRFLAGTGLDILGFAAELAALRSLPLFVVQACVAASLAVTAVAAAWWIKARLSGAEWAAVGAVCLGLAALGGSAGEESAAEASTAFRVGLLVAVAVVGLVGTGAARLTGTARTVLLGLTAGLGFGVVGVAARELRGFAPTTLLTDPAAYALAVGGVTAFLFLATALARGAVTLATAGMVLAETTAPALVGVLALGDRTRPGLGWLAVVGFTLALAGALALARFGEAEAEPQQGVETLPSL